MTTPPPPTTLWIEPHQRPPRPQPLYHGGALAPDHVGVVYATTDLDVAAWYQAGRGRRDRTWEVKIEVTRLALHPRAEIAELGAVDRPDWREVQWGRLRRLCGLGLAEIAEAVRAEGHRGRCQEAESLRTYALEWACRPDLQPVSPVWTALRTPEVWAGLRAAGIHGVRYGEPIYGEVVRWLCLDYDPPATETVTADLTALVRL